MPFNRVNTQSRIEPSAQLKTQTTVHKHATKCLTKKRLETMYPEKARSSIEILQEPKQI